MIGRLDTILVRVTGQEFSIPFSYPSATASLTFATAGNYSLEIWLESPKLAPGQLVASYTLTVVSASASAAYAKVHNYVKNQLACDHDILVSLSSHFEIHSCLLDMSMQM